ncbi:globin [Teladorsagia circumcincta]|uniref:Globin n=1 Tax=Teladorsagia circumcincta TaxID=45464 RepID=A0A2G9UN89_TELCI|nr:globin [Teladorsagia circumcincta]
MRLVILALAGFVAFASSMGPEDVRKNSLAALESVALGTTPEKVQNGKDFYKYLFTEHPEVRKYFKGAESFTADDVQKSDRFAVQGMALLTSVHILADTYDNVIFLNPSLGNSVMYLIHLLQEMIFRAFVRDLMNRHKERGLDPKLWKDFWGIFEKFLESRKPLTADQKTALDTMGTRFNDEAQKQLAVLGLPHT